MSSKKLQEIGIHKKTFHMDRDSSDDESSQQIFLTSIKPLKLALPKLSNLNKPSLNNRIDEETDNEHNLSEIFDFPKKRLHQETDSCTAHTQHDRIYKVKNLQRKRFWTVHEDEGVFPGLINHNRNHNDTIVEDDSSSEYITEAQAESLEESDAMDESIRLAEECVDFRNFIPDYCDEETVESSNHIKDVRPYLQDSDTEDVDIIKMMGKFQQKFIGNPFFVEEKMIE